MDPLTHGLVGSAISAFSGTAVGIDNPLTIGAMLGAMSPDLDFVIRLFKDDAAYLEHHRGISHSIPFLIGFSVVITLGLSFMGFEQFSFLQTLLWTFIGALSHTGLDILNSYGARLFIKKRKANLLTLYDPVITLVGFWFVLNGKNTLYELVSGTLIISIYLLMRNNSKHNAGKRINAYFSKLYQVSDISVMPSLKAFYKWDFVVHTTEYDFVGQYSPLRIKNKLQIKHRMKTVDESYYNLFRSAIVGEKFSEFSPNLHLEVTKDSETHLIIIRAIDLRYFVKENFMHHATLIVDHDHKFVSSFIHPYNMNKAIPIYQ